MRVDTAMLMLPRLSMLALVIATAQAPVPAPAPAPQNPSPMSDTTRPHPRMEPYEPKGRRMPVDGGTLFIREGLKARARMPLIVHFHGAPWVMEHHVERLKAPALLVTFQLGSGSGVYGQAFADPGAFPALLDDASKAAAQAFGRAVSFDPIVLTSFSAGYGAIRAILRQPAMYARVSSVLLADSLHADYASADGAAPRAQDLAVATPDVDVFLRLADDAAAGRKRFVVLHSEVYPGTYASTTETADALLSHLGLRRVPRLREGPIGMQQLSETTRGRFTVIGYAGNSAPDHLDQLFALGDQLARWHVTRR
jgi:hypothetical protein